MNNLTIIIILITISTFIGAIGSVFLKLGSERFRIRFSIIGVIDILKNWRIILGLFLYVTTTVFFIYCLKLGELSIVYPLTSLTYIFITILSAAILKEKINSYKLAGIFFIILGVILVTIQ